METKRVTLLMISDVVSIILSSIFAYYLFDLLNSSISYFIPFVFLGIITLLIIITFNLVSFFLTLFSFIFGKNDNNEAIDMSIRYKQKMEQIITCALMIVFTLFVVVTMFLNIYVCIVFKKYLIALVSLSLWLLIIFVLIRFLLIRRKW
jgi:hypothetical protein